MSKCHTREPELNDFVKTSGNPSNTTTESDVEGCERAIFYRPRQNNPKLGESAHPGSVPRLQHGRHEHVHACDMRVFRLQIFEAIIKVRRELVPTRDLRTSSRRTSIDGTAL